MTAITVLLNSVLTWIHCLVNYNFINSARPSIALWSHIPCRHKDPTRL